VLRRISFLALDELHSFVYSIIKMLSVIFRHLAARQTDWHTCCETWPPTANYCP